jgi:hypothetical protein
MSNCLRPSFDPAITKSLGSGGSAKRGLVLDPKTGKRLAVQCFSAVNLGREFFMEDGEAMVKPNHLCVMPIAGWTFPAPSTWAASHTEAPFSGPLERVLISAKSGRDNQF